MQRPGLPSRITDYGCHVPDYRIKDGGNGVPARSVAVKEYDVFGHEVSGGRRVGPLRRVPMTLGSDRA